MFFVKKYETVETTNRLRVPKNCSLNQLALRRGPSPFATLGVDGSPSQIGQGLGAGHGKCAKLATFQPSFFENFRNYTVHVLCINIKKKSLNIYIYIFDQWFFRWAEPSEEESLGVIIPSTSFPIKNADFPIFQPYLRLRKTCLWCSTLHLCWISWILQLFASRKMEIHSCSLYPQFSYFKRPNFLLLLAPSPKSRYVWVPNVIKLGLAGLSTIIGLEKNCQGNSGF